MTSIPLGMAGGEDVKMKEVKSEDKKSSHSGELEIIEDGTPEAKVSSSSGYPIYMWRFDAAVTETLMPSAW